MINPIFYIMITKTKGEYYGNAWRGNNESESIRHKDKTYESVKTILEWEIRQIYPNADIIELREEYING